MLNELLMFFALSCSAPVIVNNTGEWNDIDKWNLKIAMTRCGELYKNSPCVKKFIKVEENTYRVICGGKG